MPRTHYDVLMISPTADRELIGVVYRHLAKRYHPDRDPSPEAALRMAELNEAYAVLSEGASRDRYDEAIGLVMARDTVGGVQATAPASAQQPEPYGEAGPPPANPPPSGSVLTFGRYRGWALNQIARADRDYIEWLSRSTIGRNYRLELAELLRTAR